MKNIYISTPLFFVLNINIYFHMLLPSSDYVHTDTVNTWIENGNRMKSKSLKYSVFLRSSVAYIHPLQLHLHLVMADIVRGGLNFAPCPSLATNSAQTQAKIQNQPSPPACNGLPLFLSVMLSPRRTAAWTIWQRAAGRCAVISGLRSGFHTRDHETEGDILECGPPLLFWATKQKSWAY